MNANTVVKIEDFPCWNARDADCCLALMISAIGLAGIGLAFYYSYHNLYSGHRNSFTGAILGCSLLTCMFSVVVASSVIFSLTYFTFRHSTRLVSWFYSNIEQGHKEEQLIGSLKGSTKQDLLVAILLGRFGCFDSILPSNYLIEKCITTSKQEYFLSACEYLDSNSCSPIFRQLTSTEKNQCFLFFLDMGLSGFTPFAKNKVIN